jgi:hypothetical protein
MQKKSYPNRTHLRNSLGQLDLFRAYLFEQEFRSANLAAWHFAKRHGVSIFHAATLLALVDLGGANGRR